MERIRRKSRPVIDAAARRLMEPTLDACGRAIAGRGVTADGMTVAGLAFGLAAAALIVAEAFLAALLLIAASRIADGLDGAIARATRKTDFGGYLDIAADFLFYGAIPLAFVLQDTAANGAAGAWLLASFYFNGTTFLGYAVLAERRGMETRRAGSKSLYYSAGLLEGGETVALFVLFCLFPAWFAPMAWIFGALCFLTGALRVAHARTVFPA